MKITATQGINIGLHLMFQIQRLFIPEAIYFYLELAMELSFLEDWEVEGNVLILIYWEGTREHLDVHARYTVEFLRDEVQFFTNNLSITKQLNQI